MAITIKDIAKITGVSRGSVDKALNNRPGISEETRTLILRVAKELNYQPNLLGKSLVNSASPTRIGVIPTPSYNPFVQLIIEGVEAAQAEFGAFNVKTTVKTPVTMESTELLWWLDELEKEGVEGIAVLPVESKRLVKRLNQMANNGIAIVTFNSYVAGIDALCHVGQDHYNGGRTAGGLMRKMLPQGGKVGVIISFKELSCHTERLRGFRDRIADVEECPIEVVSVSESRDLMEQAFKQTTALLDMHPDLKGIYITSGGTIGAARALEMMGRSQDVFLICHDLLQENVEYMKRNTIDFAIEQNGYLQGYQSVKILFEHLVKHVQPQQEAFKIPIVIHTGDSLE